MDSTVIELLTKALVLFTAVPVHECAHAWAAEKLGDSTGREQGRITLNPFAHLTLWGSLMMIFVGFGWGKPVMVNPNNFKNPKTGMMLSSLAGPASNFVMAFFGMIVFRVLLLLSFAESSEIMMMAAQVFLYITMINLSLGIFNFLPIPPLDGSKIFNAILPDKLYFKVMQYEQYIFIALFIIMRLGILDKPLAFLNETAYSVIIFLTNWVSDLMVMILGI